MTLGWGLTFSKNFRYPALTFGIDSHFRFRKAQGNVVRHNFFARCFAPRPYLELKLGYMIYIAYIYLVSKYSNRQGLEAKRLAKNCCQKRLVIALNKRMNYLIN